MLADPRGRIPVAGDRAGLHRRRAAADRALDAVLDHEVEPARDGANDRLPALDRPVTGRGTRVSSSSVVAAIGHLRRQRVVLALVRERLLVERLDDDVDLLLEQFAVGVLVEHRRAERLDLARVVAAADAEDHAAPGQHVGDRVVLGQAQRVPHRRDVEAATDFRRFVTCARCTASIRMLGMHS